MNNLFVLTGPAGVGKSTISKGIAKRLEKSYLIEGDDLYNMIVGGYVSPWKEGNYLDLLWKNAFSLIKNSLENGFDVVFNYIIGKDDVVKIKQAFPNANIKFVVLMVDEKTIVERDKLRPEDCQMGERALVLLRELREENFDEKYILDTSNLTIEQTIEEFFKGDRFAVKC